MVFDRLFSVLLLLCIAGIQATFPLGDPATCGDCFCIPEEGEDCPVEDDPDRQVTLPQLFNLRNIQLENPIELFCNPFEDDSCDTTPPLEEEGVCTVEIYADSNKRSFFEWLFGIDFSCPSQFSYRLKTVASREEAERNGDLITHLGPCGVCSSLQDLAVYLKFPDLTSIGIGCSFVALIDFDAGVKCYEAFGFSEGCATINTGNSLNTNDKCGPLCLEKTFRQIPNNSPPPACDLDACLECDEIESGPIFAKFAGRSRRSSGILSGIARPCGTLAQGIPDLDPCNL